MKTNCRITRWLALVALAILNTQVPTVLAQGTAFTYQGQLQNAGSLANGSYNFTFALYTTNTGGTSVAGPLTNNAVGVTNGLFTVVIDFGPGVWNGATNWLQIGVETNGGSSFTALSPRQCVTPAPYAIFANTASDVSGTVSAGQVSGVLASANLPASPVFAGTVTASALAGNGAGVTNVNAAALNGLGAAGFWQLGGNNVSSGQFAGSTNYQPVEIWVNNTRALRLEPTVNDVNHSNMVNVVVGSPANYIDPGTYGSVIVGGGAVNYYGTTYTNSVSADLSFLGGGLGNSIQLSATYSFLGGGEQNSIQTNADQSFLGGGWLNSIQTYANNSFLGGGQNNSIQPDAQDAFLGGGANNSIQSNALLSVLVGGVGNSVRPDADHSFLGGGANNSIQTNAYYSVLGGGGDNSIQPNASFSFLGGGYDNFIQPDADHSFLGGGKGNSIQTYAFFAFLGGGIFNTNTGSYSAIPGGASNSAAQYSFAAGYNAQATNSGSFVWSDGTGTATFSGANNQFVARASGGFLLYSSTTNVGVSLATGSGSWSSLSDRNAKEHFAAVDPGEVLAKVVALPLTTWNYKSQDAAIRHIGPMAQDFKAAFGVGETDTGISTVDADGVALAAIQGLNQKLEETRAENAELKQENQSLAKRLSDLEALVNELAQTGK
jgi:hypothetical protein